MQKNNFRLYNTPGSNSNFPDAKKEHKVTITFTDENDITSTATDFKTYGTIIGYLSKEFEYEAHGNYSDIFNVSKSDSLMMKAFEEIAQRDVANYGVLTKKIFTHGDSPTISIEFRCWAGDSESDAQSNLSEFYSPVAIGNALINATLPRVENNNNILVQGGTVTTELVGIVKNTILDTAKNLEGAAVNFVAGDFENSVQNLKNTFNNFLSKKPPVCRVSIGNIFDKSFMVVKDVSMKLSKEYWGEGIPLYGDFSVTFQSLFAGSVLGTKGSIDLNKESMFGSGLNAKMKKTRVTFDDNNVQQNTPSNVQANQKNAPSSGEVRGSFNSPSTTYVASKTPGPGSSVKITDELKVVKP